MALAGLNDYRAFALLDDPILVVDASRILYANESSARLFGCSLEACLALSYRDAIRLSEAMWAKVLATGQCRYIANHEPGLHEWRIRCLSQEQFLVQGRCLPLDAASFFSDESVRAALESESMFRTFFQAAPYSCSVSDDHARYVLVNDAFVSQSGLTAREAVGKTAVELGLTDDTVSSTLTRHLLRDGCLDRVKVTTRGRSGEVRSLECSTRLLSLGGKVHRLSMTIDVTERVRVEEALARNERRFRMMVQNFSDIMVIVDIHHVIRFISPACERILGFSAEQMQDTPALGYVHEQDAPAVSAAFDALRSEKASSHVFEFRHRHHDGAFRWLEASGTSLLDDPEVRGMVISLRDVSGRREAEQEIAAWKNRYELIARAAGQIVYDFDIQGPVAWSGVVKDILGYEPEEMLGGVLQWEERLHPDDRPRVMQALQEAIAGDTKYSFAYRIQRKDASYVDVEETGFPYHDAGRLAGYIGVIVDISGRRALEKHRAHLEESLRQAQKMEAVGRLAGGVAHDFNNLLTVIGGSISLAVEADSVEEQRLLSVDALQAVESAASLTRQLLAFSRKQVIAPEVLSLNDVMLRAHRMLIRLIGEDIEMQSIASPNLGFARIDPGQVEQILVNLCVNARDAMPSGGMLTVETSNAFLDEDYCLRHPGVNPGEYVMLAVSDNGMGMDAETLRIVFEPFFTTKGRGKGTGLGLAMVYGAVKQNGGSIEVYSEPGHGSTFKIYLPRVDAVVVAQPATLSLSVGHGGETIVLAEDEALVRSLAVKVLQRRGYRVHAYANGEALLEALGACELQPDLLITDVVMPGINGRVLAERLREAFPSILVLFTSGYTENVVVHHGVLEEGIEFVAKPYSPELLLRRVREVLDSRGRCSSRAPTC